MKHCKHAVCFPPPRCFFPNMNCRLGLFYFFPFPIIHPLLTLCHFPVKSISIRSPLLLASSYTSAERHVAPRGCWHVRGANFRAASLARRWLVRCGAMFAGERTWLWVKEIVVLITAVSRCLAFHWCVGTYEWVESSPHTNMLMLKSTGGAILIGGTASRLFRSH